MTDRRPSCGVASAQSLKPWLSRRRSARLGARFQGTNVAPTAAGKRFGPGPGSKPGDITVAITASAAAAALRAETDERLTKRSTQRVVPAAERERVAALSYGGVSPLGTPDRSPKFFLPFLLPLVFALVAAARRVEDNDAAAAAEPGRPEDRPG